jgi:hypothetical protein
VQHQKYGGGRGRGRGREVCANIVIWRSDVFMGNFQHFGKDNILSQTLFVKTKSPKNKKILKNCKKLPQLPTI